MGVPIDGPAIVGPIPGPMPGPIPGGGIMGGAGDSGPGGGMPGGGMPGGGMPGAAIGGPGGCTGSALPQLRQNFMPGGLSPRQTGHWVGNPGGGAGVGA
jgi:hypothetical protein